MDTVYIVTARSTIGPYTYRDVFETENDAIMAKSGIERLKAEIEGESYNECDVEDWHKFMRYIYDVKVEKFQRIDN